MTSRKIVSSGVLIQCGECGGGQSSKLINGLGWANVRSGNVSGGRMRRLTNVLFIQRICIYAMTRCFVSSRRRGLTLCGGAFWNAESSARKECFCGGGTLSKRKREGGSLRNYYMKLNDKRYLSKYINSEYYGNRIRGRNTGCVSARSSEINWTLIGLLLHISPVLKLYHNPRLILENK